MADLMDRFWTAPPVTRTLVAAMFTESALIHGGILPFHYFVFYTPWLFKFPPEIWRMATAFLVTRGGFSFVFDLYFTWTYASGLELNSPRFTEPGSFFIYLVFVSTVIMVTGGFLLGGYFLTSALILAFMYTFAQDNKGTKAHFVIFRMPVEFLPWATLLLTLILEGSGPALIQATGILGAHMYDFLTRLYPTFQGGRNYIQTPPMVKRWLGAETSSYTQKKYGSSYRSAQPAQATSSRGWTSGFTSGSWGGRGAGRRLGGD